MGLTSIQDSIEDADNEKNRKKVKSLKRERKDKEEMERFTRQKEQEAIIERQRLQIEQLLQKQSSGHTLQTPMKSVGHRSTNSVQLDFNSPMESDSKLRHRTNSLDRTRTHSVHYFVDDDGTDE